MAAARQEQAAARLAGMNTMRMRGGIRVNVNPTINVTPTFNIGGPTSHAASNPVVTVPTTTPPVSQTPPTTTAPTTPPLASTPPTSTPATPTQPAQPNTPSQPAQPAQPAQPSRPTSPGRPGNIGSWTDVTRPGGPTAKPTTPSTPNQPSKPTTPTQPSKPTTPAEPSTPTPPAKPTTPAEPSTPTPPAKPAPTFPNGTVLRDEQTGELGYYSQGKRGLISPPIAAKMGLTADKTTAVSADDFQAVPKGPDYYPEGIFVRGDQTGEISRFSDGKFHVVSTPVSTYLGVGADSVATIPAAQYGNTPMGDDYFPEGLLIQNQQSGEINIYQGGQRHWISVPVAARLNLQASQIVVISPSQFDGVARGKDYFPEGVYLQNQDSGEIAHYEGGKLRVVSSPVASRLGLKAADLISVSPSQYKAVEQGADYFMEGMFLKNNQTGELANYYGGQRHWVSSPAATEINLTDAMVTTIGADQFNAIPRGDDFVPPPPIFPGPTPPAEA
jgi:hypothetical protein